MNIFDLQESRVFSPDKMTKNSLAETDRFFCDLYCLEPGQEQKSHAHGASDKVYIVIEGRGMVRVGPEERELGPHQGVLAPAGSEHGVKNLTKEPLVLLVMVAPNPNR